MPLDELRSDPRPRAAVVVAHPDDETLWCGGYILTHPEFLWRILTLCRAVDPDRAPKFRRVLQRLGAEGDMADLDDGPDQAPLPAGQVRRNHRAAAGWNQLQPDFDPRPQWASTRGIAGIRSAATAWLRFGGRATSTPGDCGCLLTKTGAGRTSLGFATMRIGGTC